MDDLEQEIQAEELLQFAIQESFQDSNKLPSSLQPLRHQPASEDFLKIMAAIQTGDVFALQQMSASAAFRERGVCGRLPLHAAAVQLQQDVLHQVSQAVLTCTDLSLDERTRGGDTTLTLAAEAGRLENVRLLLTLGASPNEANGKNETPLLIAVRQTSYEMVLSLIVGGASVEQVCLKQWTAVHEAAKVGCRSILMLLLHHGAKVTARDVHGVTPLGIAAKHGNTEALDILIQHGGDVQAQAFNGDSVLNEAAACNQLQCVELLLQRGADPNAASYACQLPVHKAARLGHLLVLRRLLPLTTQRALRLAGHSPLHAAADGGQAQCLQLLIQSGLDVNSLLDTHISETYGDLRKTALYFAVSNGDITCAEMLLVGGAKTDLDPLRCLLVAVRAQRYELVQLLLSYGADVNCYFQVVSNTAFPTALQYSLKDAAMLRILLNGGYQAQTCFQCCHGNSEELDSRWADLHQEAYQIYREPKSITFCEFVSVSWLTHLAGNVVRMLLDYVPHVRICPDLRRILEKSPEWEEIADIVGNPRSLQHLCRLVIRGHMSLRVLNDPHRMAGVPTPPRLKSFLTYREKHLHRDLQ